MVALVAPEGSNMSFVLMIISVILLLVSIFITSRTGEPLGKLQKWLIAIDIVLIVLWFIMYITGIGEVVIIG